MSGATLLRAVAGPSLILGLLWFADVGAIFSVLAQTDPFDVGIAVTLLLATTLMGAFNVYLLIREPARISYRHFLGVYWIAWSINLVVPGQVGDIGGMSALLKRRGVPLHITLGRSLLDKVISIAVIAAAGMTGVIIYGPAWRFQTHAPGLWGAAVAFLVLLAVAVLYLRYRRVQLLQDVGRVLFASLRELSRTARSHPALVLLNLLITSCKLILTGAAYWIIFNGLGSTVEFWPLLLLSTACSLVAYIPISFNGLGTVEVAAVYLLGYAGIAAPVVVSGYLLLRAMVLASAWLPVAMWLCCGGRFPPQQQTT